MRAWRIAGVGVALAMVALATGVLNHASAQPSVAVLTNASFGVVWGSRGERAYIGGDGQFDGNYPDVQLGSLDPNVTWVTLWNHTGAFRMNLLLQNLRALGTKSFVMQHPRDPQKEIVYSSLEGPEAGTYLRGTASLHNGEAVIEPPEHFSMVTSEEGLMTVQLTPIGQWLQLYIVEKSPHRIVVREAQGRDGQFDYLIQGVRRGYEGYQVIRQKGEP
jgi:hypothetical protein